LKNDFLEKLFKRKGGIKLGLGRVAGAFPSVVEKKIPVYHVAGTNGKGTAVYSIAHILEKNGFRTGRFISPHLFDFNERISVDGVDISDAKVKELYEFLEKNVKDFESLSFFEVTFLMAWKHFELENCDRIVLEVGLGGRLDATNVIDWPKTDIITSIGLDHTHILGDTIEKIASEKLGIVKKGDAVVLNSDCKWLNEDALSRGAKTVIDESYCGDVEINRDDLSADQIKNIKLAASAVKISEKNIVIPDFSQIVLPGRFQLIEPCVRIDVAHNPPAMRSLVEHTAKKGITPVVLFGAMKDKNIEAVLDEIAKIAVEIYVITVEEENRGASADEIILRSSEYAEKIIKKSQNDEETMKNALLSAHANNTELLVTGSFYTIEKFVKWRKNF
jgi:dihydrofolate synthase / folylpolyglutamate synthase